MTDHVPGESTLVLSERHNFASRGFGPGRSDRRGRRAVTKRAAAAACGSGLDGVLELGAGAEPRRFRRLDGHGLTGGGVDAPTRGAVRDRELAEPGDVDLRPGGERLLDGLQGRVEHAPGLGSRY